ncbi:MAG: LysR substrate-binding domain-containing protein [Oscillospiraceae bacterium]|nr:LysR substrate-binding domain-containing protein [Oscillospiraceae bacterium]
MTLRLLRIFAAVCQAGSMTGASRRLHVSQPAVSSAIHELETHYDTRLFERVSRRLVLTANGQQLLDRVRPILAQLDELEQQAQGWSVSQQLCIGATLSIGSKLLPALVSAYAQRQPQVRVRVRVASSDLIEQAVLRHELDFALIEGLVHSERLSSRVFKQDRLCALALPQLYPQAGSGELDARGLLQLPLLLRETGSGTRERFEQALAAVELSCPEPAWESHSSTALLSAACQGLGVAILPRILALDLLRQGSLAELTVRDLDLRRSLRLIYLSTRPADPAAAAFIQLLEAEP